MTQEEIIEGNIKIAMFMRAKYWPDTNNPLAKYSDAYELEYGIAFAGYQLQYHNDLNWIMKVVDKIEKLNNGFDGKRGSGKFPLRFQIKKLENEENFEEQGKCQCYILFNQTAECTVEADTRRGAIWRCVVEFIDKFGDKI